MKAVLWWCYTHSPHPEPAATILATIPTDAALENAWQRATPTCCRHNTRGKPPANASCPVALVIGGNRLIRRPTRRRHADTTPLIRPIPPNHPQATTPGTNPSNTKRPITRLRADAGQLLLSGGNRLIRRPTRRRHADTTPLIRPIPPNRSQPRHLGLTPATRNVL